MEVELSLLILTILILFFINTATIHISSIILAQRQLTTDFMVEDAAEYVGAFALLPGISYTRILPPIKTNITDIWLNNSRTKSITPIFNGRVLSDEKERV